MLLWCNECGCGTGHTSDCSKREKKMAFVEVAEDVWVNPEAVDYVELDTFQGEPPRVMLRFQGGQGKLLPIGVAMADVMDVLNEEDAI